METSYQTYTQQSYNMNMRFRNINLTQNYFMPRAYSGGKSGGGGGCLQRCTCPTYRDLLTNKILDCILYTDKESKFSWDDNLFMGHEKALEKLLYLPPLRERPKIEFLCGYKFDSDSLCATLPKDIIQLIFTSIYPLANFKIFENFVTSNRTQWEREKEIYLDSNSFPSKSDVQFLSGYKFDTFSLNQVLPAEIMNIILTFKYCLLLTTDRNSWELDVKFSSDYGITISKCTCFSNPFGLERLHKIQNDILPKFIDLKLPKIDLKTLTTWENRDLLSPDSEIFSIAVSEDFKTALSNVMIDSSEFVKEMLSDNYLIPIEPLKEPLEETGTTSIKASNSCVIC